MGEDGPRLPVQLPLAALVAVPGVYLGAATYLGLPHPSLPPPLAALMYGVSIVGGAFLLSWAAEAVQVDISAGMAIALLALLAVLPEYAVDFVFTLHAGQMYAEYGTCLTGPGGADPCSLALANMTGANRVLVGVGWPLVVLVASVAAWRARHGGGDESASTHVGRVDLGRPMSVEVVFSASPLSTPFPFRCGVRSRSSMPRSSSPSS